MLRSHIKQGNFQNAMLQPQLILLWSKLDGNGVFVNFLIITDPSYIETRFKNVKDNLGKNEINTGLNFAGSVIQGKFCFQHGSCDSFWRCSADTVSENEYHTSND